MAQRLWLALLVCGCESSSAAPSSERSATAAPSDAGALASREIGWPWTLPIDLEPAPLAGQVVVYLDAGHGATGNSGNSSAFCVREQDFTLSLGDDVIGALEALGGYRVVPSRVGDQLVSYAERVAAAERLDADVFVSLHSDVRGRTEEWSPDGIKTCLRSHDAPGFSLLFSDEGPPALVEERRRLAESFAGALFDAGFVPYRGEEYAGLYEGAPAERGVFVDRHAPDKRIFVLRRTRMPAVIIETHNALDPREAVLFEDPLVRRSFALAVARGIKDALGR